MVSQQRSFHLIECPTGVCRPHARLVVNGRGVPHESLTVFYEELQKMHWVHSMSRASVHFLHAWNSHSRLFMTKHGASWSPST